MSDQIEDWAEREAPRLLARAREEAMEVAAARLRDRHVDALLRAAAAPAGSRHQERRSAAPSGVGLWVYGVIPGDAAGPGDRTGVDGGAVEVMRHGDVAALVTRVPLERFGEEAIKERLEDLEQLEALARAHDEILAAALAAGDVVPFRLCTIYESADSLRGTLGRDGAELAAALARVSGKEEWGVKALLGVPDAVASGQPAPAPASGADYLSRKRERRVAAEARSEAAESVVAGIHARLAERASAAVLSRPQDRRLSGRDADMLLNGAYLVPRESAQDFTAFVDELAQRYEEDGLLLERSGPWPPYHFVEGAQR